MKKYFLLIGLMIAIALQASAAQENVRLRLQKRGDIPLNTTVRRTPMQVPVEVSYDNETRQVEVSGDEETDV